MFVFENVEITITNSDDTTESFTLEAPTRDDSSRFEYGFQRLSLKQTYRDRNLVNRRGTEYYQFVCTLSYSWHRMDLRKLLTAKSIALKIPPTFGDVESYQSFDVRLGNDDVVRNWLSGAVIGGNPESGGSSEQFNPIPSGEASLRFLGTKAFQASEVLDAGVWFQPTSEPPEPEPTAETRNISSMSFDGVDDYVNAGNDASLKISGAITISAWVYAESFTDGFETVLGNGRIWDSTVGNSRVASFFLGMINGVPRFQIWESNTVRENLASSVTLDTGKWFHIACVWDGTNNADNMKIYINGVLDATSSQSTVQSIFDSGEPVVIGNDLVRLTEDNDQRMAWNGKLDEVQLWQKALSASEIRTNMNKILEGTETDLVGYWNAEDRNDSQLTDLTSNNNHGTINGATYAYDGFDFDYGLDFDGTDDYVSVGASFDISGDALTVEALVKPNVNNVTQRIFRKAIGWDDNGEVDLYLRSNGEISFVIVASGSNYEHLQTTTVGYSAGEWIHVAGVYDGATMKIYVNGIEVASVAKTGSIVTGTAPFLIGAENISGLNVFDGVIDKARVWGVVRTANQLRLNINKELEGDESGLLGYWKFDDLSDLGVAVDSSPNGNNGVINGAKYSTEIVSYWQALNFDGIDDYAEINPLSNNESVSMCMLFRLDGLTGSTQYIAGQGIVSGGSEDKGFGFFVRDDRSFVFQCRDGTNATVNGETSAGFIEVDKWYAVTGTRNSATNETKLYIDGVLIDTGTGSIPTIVTPSGELFSVARRYPNSDLYANITIANMQVWDKVLDATEADENPATFLQGNETDLLAYWPMVEGVGANAYDHKASSDLPITGAVFTESVGYKP